MRRINSVGGMNKSHRLSHGAKKVTPPSIPSFNQRGSGSSFGSDYSYERDDSAYSRDPSGGTANIPEQRSNFTKEQFNKENSTDIPSGMYKGNILSTVDIHTMEDQGIDMTMSPGRDSPGDDSSASIGTVESSSVSSGGAGPGTHIVGSFGGCRNSTTSLDSGRASNTNSATTNSNDGTVNSYQLSTFHTIQPIQEHKAMVNVHPPQAPSSLMPNRLYSQIIAHSTDSEAGKKYQNHASSFRQSYHSSTSSLGSADRAGQDTICALNIPEMVANGVHDHEILLAWLTDLHYEEYYELFVSAGYDMPTISRMTPEDLTAIGIKKPNHRKRLKSEITLLNIPDGLPSYIPDSLEEWLHCIRLSEYINELRHQGYFTIDDVAQISIEDFEDVGLYKLGHQKRLLLAIKRMKELKSGRRMTQFHPPPSSLQITASPLPSRSNINQNHTAGTMSFPSYGQQFPKNKHLQNFAIQTIPPQVPQPRQSSNALQINSEYSNTAYSNNALHCSIEKESGILQGNEHALQQIYANVHQQGNLVGSSKPIYQPEIIRIDCASTTLLPAAPSPLLKGHQQVMYPNVASPAPPPPPLPLRQSSCLTDPADGGSPPPPSPPSMPQPMAPLLSNYPRFQEQEQYIPQGVGFQTTFQNKYPPEVSNEVQNRQNIPDKPWGAASMTRSFDDGDIANNYYSNMHRGNYFAHQGGTGIVRNPNSLAMNNSGGGTLPRPKGLVKPRPVAKIAANPQTPLQQKQSMSNMSDLQEVDMCKTALSSFVPTVEQSSAHSNILENKYGSQKNIGCYDQGETFANDNVGTIRMRSNSHVLTHFSENASSGFSTTEGSTDNEQIVRLGSSKLIGEGDTGTNPSQDSTKRTLSDGMVNGQRSAGDVLNDIGSMLSDLTDELDAMLHMERDTIKN